MRLKDIMTTNVRCVRRDETLTRAASIMQRRGIHHLVVAMAPASSALRASALQTRDAEGVAKVGDAVARRVVLGSPEMTVRQAAPHAHLPRQRPADRLEASASSAS